MSKGAATNKKAATRKRAASKKKTATEAQKRVWQKQFYGLNGVQLNVSAPIENNNKNKHGP